MPGLSFDEGRLQSGGTSAPGSRPELQQVKAEALPWLIEVIAGARPKEVSRSVRVQVPPPAPTSACALFKRIACDVTMIPPGRRGWNHAQPYSSGEARYL